MKISHQYVFFAIVFALFVAACGGADTTGKRKSKEQLAAEKTKDSLALKVGVAKTADCLPAFVAKDEGLFDSLGVDVKFVFFTSLLDCEKQLQKGNLDGAFIDTKRMAFLKEKYSLDMDTIAVTGMQWSLVANRKSRLRSVKQLAEKTVGMTRHSATDYLTDKVLDSVKADKDKVFKIQVNDVDLRLRMLVNGEIDAAWLPEPQLTEAQRRGCNILARGNGKNAPMSVLAFTTKALADKRKQKQTEVFREAYGLAQRKIKEHTIEAKRELVTKYYGYAAK